MKRISAGRVGLLQGSRILFSDFKDGGVMWTGQGPRESRHAITFDHPFSATPLVSVSVSMWDLDQKTNTRADIAAEAVTIAGFDLVFRTWGDSRVARIRADWLAIGEVRDDDDWDVD